MRCHRQIMSAARRSVNDEKRSYLSKAQVTRREGRLPICGSGFLLASFRRAGVLDVQPGKHVF